MVPFTDSSWDLYVVFEGTNLTGQPIIKAFLNPLWVGSGPVS